MFAVIKSGGRQYKVSVGQTLEVNRLPVDDGAQVKFDEVLLISDENGSMIGTPLVDNAMVLATAVKQGRGEKLIVFRYKSKKRFRHRRGHRQELTILTIDDIVADGKSLITGNAPVAKETPAEEEVVAALKPLRPRPRHLKVKPLKPKPSRIRLAAAVLQRLRIRKAKREEEE